MTKLPKKFQKEEIFRGITNHSIEEFDQLIIDSLQTVKSINSAFIRIPSYSNIKLSLSKVQ